MTNLVQFLEVCIHVQNLLLRLELSRMPPYDYVCQYGLVCSIDILCIRYLGNAMNASLLCQLNYYHKPHHSTGNRIHNVAESLRQTAFGATGEHIEACI